MQKTALAVVGAGNWGRNHVRTLSQMGCLGAVVEVSKPLREAVAAEHPGVPVTGELDAVLEDSSIKGLVIATPAQTHAAVARRCLEAGKDVLVEKPLTLSVGDAEELVDFAREKNRILMVGHLQLFQPAIQRIREILASGALGTLFTLHQIRAKLGRARAHEDVLWSFGVHDLAVFLHLIGEEPVTLQAAGHSGLQPGAGIADVAHLAMTFPSGVQAYLHSSWLWPQAERRLTIVGSIGMLVYDEITKKVILHRKSIDSSLQNRDLGEEVVYEGNDEPLRLELEHFLDCIQTRRTPIPDGRNGLQVVRILEQADRQMQGTPRH